MIKIIINIIKITVIKKNRDEKGGRAESFRGQIHIQMGIFFIGLH